MRLLRRRGRLDDTQKMTRWLRQHARKHRSPDTCSWCRLWRDR